MAKQVFRLSNLLSGLPGRSQWRAEGKEDILVYGGGSALALHEIPYQAPKGALHPGSIPDPAQGVKTISRLYYSINQANYLKHSLVFRA